MANGNRFGLAASIWTNNIKLAHRVASNIDAGIIWINDHHKNDPSSPWGGFKDSGNHSNIFNCIIYSFIANYKFVI